MEFSDLVGITHLTFPKPFPNISRHICEHLMLQKFPVIMRDVTNMKMAKQVHAVLHFIVDYFRTLSVSKIT